VNHLSHTSNNNNNNNNNNNDDDGGGGGGDNNNNRFLALSLHAESRFFFIFVLLEPEPWPCSNNFHLLPQCAPQTQFL
jgi:hypothetical protein